MRKLRVFTLTSIIIGTYFEDGLYWIKTFAAKKFTPDNKSRTQGSRMHPEMSVAPERFAACYRRDPSSAASQASSG